MSRDSQRCHGFFVPDAKSAATLQTISSQINSTAPDAPSRESSNLAGQVGQHGDARFTQSAQSAGAEIAVTVVTPRVTGNYLHYLSALFCI